MNPKLLAALLVALLLLLFTAQNFQVVEVRFLIWKLEMSRAVLIPAVFVAGIVVGALVASLRRMGRT